MLKIVQSMALVWCLVGCASGPTPRQVLGRIAELQIPMTQTAVQVCKQTLAEKLADAKPGQVDAARDWGVLCLQRVTAQYELARSVINAALQVAMEHEAGEATEAEALAQARLAYQAAAAFARFTDQLGVPVLEGDNPFALEVRGMPDVDASVE